MANKTIVHIRKRLPRKGGNSFYHDKTVRESATFCGAACTELDVDYRTAGTKKFQQPPSSDVAWWAMHPTCPSCLSAFEADQKALLSLSAVL